MLPAVIAAALALAAVQVEVTPLSGSAVTGELTRFDGRILAVQTSGGEQQFPVKGLRSLAFPNHRPAIRQSGPRVDLTDGSTLRALSYSVDEGAAAVKLDFEVEVSTSTKLVAAVLLRDQTDEPKLAEQWRTILNGNRNGDQIIVRRKRQNDAGATVLSLDQLEGVLYDIGETVGFGLDEQRREVPLDKLEGFVYFHPGNPALAEMSCRVTDAAGSVWNVSTLSIRDERLELATAAGVKVSLPIEQIAQIDFDSGNIVYLSDLEPESVEWTPYIETRVSPERLLQMFGPHRDLAFGRRKLRLEDNGPVFEKGLSLHSRTQLTYRLTEPYQRLQAIIGLDPKYRKAGDLELSIRSQDQVLFRGRFTADQAPQEIDLSVAGAQRLTILVDFGEKWDIADHINLCDIRFTK